jgi:DNA polymerase III sliding clamp (beta) subunit (PCNA family)
MKFTATRSSILPALSLAASVAPTRTTGRECLTHLLLSASDARCEAIATDMEIAAVRRFTADVEKAGSALAPASLLLAMVRAMPDEDISFRMSGTKLAVTCSSCNHEMPTMGQDEFPPLPNPAWTATAKMPAAAMSAAIRAVLPFADDRASKYALGALRVELGQSAHFVGTGGTALGAVEVAADSSSEAGALVPQKAAKLIAGFDGGDCILSVESNWIGFECGEAKIMARQVDGRFPRWRDLLTGSGGVAFSPDGLLGAIQRTCVAPADSDDYRWLTLAINDGRIELAYTAGGIDSRSSIPVAESPPAGPVQIQVPFAKSAIDGLRLLGSEPAEILIQGKELPVFIHRGDARFVIMPRAER